MEEKTSVPVEISSRLSPAKSIAGAITALLVCAGFFLYLNSLGLRVVYSVMGASHTDYPGITYEQAFSSFYGNPKWEYIRYGNSEVVRFTGNCYYYGRKVIVELDYLLSGDRQTFTLYEGKINGEKKNLHTLIPFHIRPFSDYGRERYELNVL